MKHLNNFNESIKDKMTPKSEEEMKPAILKSLGFETEEEMNKAIEGDGKDKVYHVYSGVDAFVFMTDNGETLFSPYIAIIATSELDARIKTAKMLGQELFDQETNGSYKNYVSNAEYQYDF